MQMLQERDQIPACELVGVKALRKPQIHDALFSSSELSTSTAAAATRRSGEPQIDVSGPGR